MADWKNVAIEDLERQIAELQAQIAKATDPAYLTEALEKLGYGNIVERLEAAEALPLKDEVERVLEEARIALHGEAAGRTWYEQTAEALEDVDTILSRLRAGEQEGCSGLSEWVGWDKSHDPWGETKHKDAVLEALFRGPWSVEDAATLIGFIDRTWTRRPAAPKQGEAK